jgi:hypothetical protein
MVGSLFSSIGGLLGLALIFATLWEFFRGMRALAQIANSLERIEHILTKGPSAVPSPPASHTAT